MKKINYNHSETQRMNLDNEVFLDESIKPAKEDSKGSGIFLTGGTGFLGAYLIRDLLQGSTESLFCLVRAETTESGKNRILQNLKTYGISIGEKESHRIIAICGDLSKPNLGLDHYAYDDLANKVRLIIHSGATVYYFMPYDTMKQINVNGTKEILKFSCRNYNKKVHYVSSYSIFGSNHYKNKSMARETSVEGLGEGFKLGYVQSKWVAEKLCDIALKRGLAITIYRPGIISADNETGIMHGKDFIFRLIDTCKNLEIAPYSNTKLHLTPVNYCSSTIVYLTQCAQKNSSYYNLINPFPITWDELIKNLERQGQVFEKMDPNQFWHKITENINTKNLLAALVMLSPKMKDQIKTWKKLDIMHLNFETSFTQEHLKNTSIKCAKLNDSLLKTYFLK